MKFWGGIYRHARPVLYKGMYVKNYLTFYFANLISGYANSAELVCSKGLMSVSNPDYS